MEQESRNESWIRRLLSGRDAKCTAKTRLRCRIFPLQVIDAPELAETLRYRAVGLRKAQLGFGQALLKDIFGARKVALTLFQSAKYAFRRRQAGVDPWDRTWAECLR